MRVKVSHSNLQYPEGIQRHQQTRYGSHATPRHQSHQAPKPQSITGSGRAWPHLSPHLNPVQVPGCTCCHAVLHLDNQLRRRGGRGEREGGRVRGRGRDREDAEEEC